MIRTGTGGNSDNKTKTSNEEFSRINRSRDNKYSVETSNGAERQKQTHEDFSNVKEPAAYPREQEGLYKRSARCSDISG
jgi:hypothetical protein